MCKRALRQLVSLFLALVVTFVLIPTHAHALDWAASGSCEWSIDAGTLVVRPADGQDEGTLGIWDDESGVPWYYERDGIVSARFEGTVYAETCLGLFSGCSALESADLSGLNTAQAKDMSSMFSGCSSLAVIDLSGCDPWQVTTMASMFSGCSSLTSLDLSSWETAEVTDMSCLFDGCSSLTSVQLTGWDTSNVHDFTATFRGCTSLASLDLSSWDTSYAYRMESLFEGCSGLATVKLSEGFSFCGYEKDRLCSLPSGGWVAGSDGAYYDQDEVPNNRADTYRYREPRRANPLKVTPKAMQTMAHQTTDKVLDCNVTVTGAKGAVSYANVSTGDAEFFDVDASTGKVTVSGWTDAGTYTMKLAVSAEGDDDYEPATVTTSYTIKIERTPIEDVTAAKVADQDYTGSAIEPEPTLTWTGETLEEDLDYSLSYTSNVGAGTATVTMTGKGSFTGKKSQTFKIKKVSLDEVTIPAIADQVYTGSAIKPSPALTWKGKKLKNGTDYTLGYRSNVNAGTATVTVTGKGSFTGTKRLTFKIKTINLSEVKVPSIESQTYTGTAIKPAQTLMWKGKKLKRGTDYTIGYKSNVNVGTATVTVTGRGSFAGTKRLTFKIKPADINNVTVNAIADQVYNGKGRTPKPTLKYEGKTLKNNSDFTLTYSNNVKVSGKAKVTIKGKGNFTGSKTLSFRIAFSDVPKSNALYDHIHRAADLGIINGYSGSDYGKFGPKGNVTRGQMAVILWNMAGKPKPKAGAKAFPDVLPRAYYEEAVAWASSMGIVNGYANGNYGPGDNITREQLAVMVANYAKKAGGVKVSGSAKDISQLVDGDSVSGYAVSSVAWCFKKGIILTQGGRLNPQQLATRATAAQMAVDLHDLLE